MKIARITLANGVVRDVPSHLLRINGGTVEHEKTLLPSEIICSIAEVASIDIITSKQAQDSSSRYIVTLSPPVEDHHISVLQAESSLARDHETHPEHVKGIFGIYKLIKRVKPITSVQLEEV